MGISKKTIETRLRPYLFETLGEAKFGLLSPAMFLSVYNEVARNLNTRGRIHLERFYKKMNSDNAANNDSSYTNYDTQREIEEVVSFRFETGDWQKQYYTYTGDRLAMKGYYSGALMDMLYLGRCENVVADGDEIDLPVEIETEFLELVRMRINADLGVVNYADYQQGLEFYGSMAADKIPRKVNQGKGISRHFFYEDDSKYVITDKFISTENFITDANGILTYVDNT